MLDIRYPPYTLKKQQKFMGMNEIKPDFDRDGNLVGWAAWLKGMFGGKGGMGLAAVVSK